MLHPLKGLAEAARTANRRRLQRRRTGSALTDSEWIRRHDTLNEAVPQALQRRRVELQPRPLIALLMPVCHAQLSLAPAGSGLAPVPRVSLAQHSFSRAASAVACNAKAAR